MIRDQSRNITGKKKFKQPNLLSTLIEALSIQTVKMSSENPIILGQRGFQLFVNEFKGEPKIHRRKQFEDPVSGYPTKFGVTLSLQEWEDIKRSSAIVDGRLKTL